MDKVDVRTSIIPTIEYLENEDLLGYHVGDLYLGNLTYRTTPNFHLLERGVSV